MPFSIITGVATLSVDLPKKRHMVSLYLKSADDDFCGIIESRPGGKVGTWIVGGCSFEVTELTDLEKDDGPLKIAACLEVDTDDGKVEEIGTEPSRKCRK